MPSLTASILVRLRAPRLDADLAAGWPPEASSRHEARARQLVNPRMRHTLAGSWEDVLFMSHRPADRLSGRVPICRDRVRRAEPEIRELIAALQATGPVPARGVAMAVCLLTDGAGPIYDPKADHLTAAVALAVDHLNPALPLTFAANA